MDNKQENFYTYMGKVFGSRIVQKQTNDRIYDDIDAGEPYHFVQLVLPLVDAAIARHK